MIRIAWSRATRYARTDMPVPWTQIIQWVPPIVELSRDLLARARKTRAPLTSVPPPTNPDDFAGRLAALEENERRQAELVNRMAEQIAQLSAAVIAFHRLGRWLIMGVITLAIIALLSLFR